jgi:3-phenylpropionate/trans-cinnamate dioxygenase ferredoxin reductase subunit
MIAIVGAGGTGLSAAVALRELGYEDALRLFGSEPCPPYDRTTLSKNFLTQAAEAPPPALADTPADLELSLGTEVVAIEPEERALTTSAGEIVPFDKLLIATGAACRRLDIPGADLEGVHYLRELDDATALREALQPGARFVVVGGGVIGLELAASALQLGCTVTVVEAAPHIMGRVLPAELSDLVADEHRARGVTILTGNPPTAFVGLEGRIRGVAMADGSGIPADVVVVGIGIVPRAELAARAGLAIDNGILVDERFRTSKEAIFAAGDAARVFHVGRDCHIRTESWLPALEQGRLAAANMLGVETPYNEVPWMWSDQHELTIQVTGFGFDGAEILRRGDLSNRDGVGYFALRQGRLVAAGGVSVGARIARMIRPAQMLIEANAAIDATALGDLDFDLRGLLQATGG